MREEPLVCGRETSSEQIRTSVGNSACAWMRQLRLNNLSVRGSFAVVPHFNLSAVHGTDEVEVAGAAWTKSTARPSRKLGRKCLPTSTQPDCTVSDESHRRT
jgi:hypothetical protein